MKTIKKGRNKRILCKIGLHKWSKLLRHSISSSNVIDLERYCKNCGQQQRKVKTR